MAIHTSIEVSIVTFDDIKQVFVSTENIVTTSEISQLFIKPVSTNPII